MHPRFPWLLSASLGFCWPIPAAAQSTEPLPEAPPGFEVKLYASGADVAYPSAICAGPDGTLFVAQDNWNGNRAVAAKRGDFIRRWRDADDDGVGDGFTMFWDGGGPSTGSGQGPSTSSGRGLNAVAGLAWRDGWLYVVHCPKISRLRDTDGDGTADEIEDLVVAERPQVTEILGAVDHRLQGCRFGVDGKLYVASGDMGLYRARGRDGKVLTFRGGGVLRLNPDGTGLEVFASGIRNAYDLGLDAEDRVLVRDNNDDGGVWGCRLLHLIEGGEYGYPYLVRFAPDEALPPLAETADGSPAGGLVYQETAFPPEYRGAFLTAEWGRQRVLAHLLTPKGAGFAGKPVEKVVLRPADEMVWRPVDLEVARDGSLYVADWVHAGWNELEPRGRIFTLRRAGAASGPSAPEVDAIARMSVEACLPLLASPSRRVRDAAQLALEKAGPVVVPELVALLRDPAATFLQKLHGVWILARRRQEPTLREFTHDEDPRVRAQAARALGGWGGEAGLETVARIIDLTRDPDASVRLQATTALSRFRNLYDTSSAAGPATRFRTAAVDRLWDLDPLVRHRAVRTLRDLGAWTACLDVLAGPPARFTPAKAGALRALSACRDVEDVKRLADRLKTSGIPPERAAIVRILDRLARIDAPWNGDYWSYRPWQRDPDPPVRWAGTPAVLAALEGAIGDPDPATRRAAAAAMARHDPDRWSGELADFLVGDPDPAARRAIVDALGLAASEGAFAPLDRLAGVLAADDPLWPAVSSAAARLPDPEGTMLLRRLVRSPSDDAAQEAVNALHARRDEESARPMILRFPTAGSPLRRAILQTLRAFGDRRAIEIAGAALHDPSRDVRLEAVRLLRRIPDVASDLRDDLLPLLSDADPEIVRGTAAALSRIAGPGLAAALRPMLDRPETRAGALGVFLEFVDRAPHAKLLEVARAPGLPESLRVDVADAMESLRARTGMPSAPALVEALARLEGELIAKSRPIETWWVAAPFAAGARSPYYASFAPETGPPDLDARYGSIGWRPLRGEGPSAVVDLAPLAERARGKLVAYAWAQIESPAETATTLWAGSDDDLTVWVNGARVLGRDVLRSLEPDQDRADIRLRKGTNTFLVKVGQQGGKGWGFCLRLGAPPPEPPEAPYLRALAAAAAGGPPAADRIARGAGAFFDKGTCGTCHAAGGRGSKIGPDLSEIGAKYPRAFLAESILEPAKVIRGGYEQEVLELEGEDVLIGTVTGDTPKEVTVMRGDGSLVRVPKRTILLRRPSALSAMPEGLERLMTPEEFADLVLYMESLKGTRPEK